MTRFPETLPVVDRRPARWGVGLAVSVLVLAACGGSDDSSMPETTSGAATVAPATEAPTTEAPTTDAPVTEPPATEAERSGAECVVGDWELRAADFLDEISALVAASGQPGAQLEYRSGRYLATFAADGAFTGRREQFSFRVISADGNLVTTIDSTDPGTWSATEGELTVVDPGSPATVKLQLEVDGVLQDLPMAGEQTVGGQAFSGAGPYRCTGDVLTTEFPDEVFGSVTSTWDRIG